MWEQGTACEKKAEAVGEAGHFALEMGTPSDEENGDPSAIKNRLPSPVLSFVTDTWLAIF